MKSVWGSLERGAPPPEHRDVRHDRRGVVASRGHRDSAVDGCGADGGEEGLARHDVETRDQAERTVALVLELDALGQTWPCRLGRVDSFECPPREAHTQRRLSCADVPALFFGQRSKMETAFPTATDLAGSRSPQSDPFGTACQNRVATSVAVI